jgi:hypothetical protein
MRYVLPFILSACAAEAAPTARPVVVTMGAVSVDCVDGLGEVPSVPGAIVQAAACNVDGACWSAQWGEEAGMWRANCTQGATVVEWTWIAPAR